MRMVFDEEINIKEESKLSLSFVEHFQYFVLYSNDLFVLVRPNQTLTLVF